MAEKKVGNTFAAAAIGAAIGAAGTAAAIALSDPKNQKKVSEVANNIGDQAKKYHKQAMDKFNEFTNNPETKRAVTDTAASVQDKIDAKTNRSKKYL